MRLEIPESRLDTHTRDDFRQVKMPTRHMRGDDAVLTECIRIDFEGFASEKVKRDRVAAECVYHQNVKTLSLSRALLLFEKKARIALS